MATPEDYYNNPDFDKEKFELVPYEKVMEFMRKYYTALYGRADVLYAPNCSSVVIIYITKCGDPKCETEHLIQSSIEVFEDGTCFQEKGVDIDVEIEKQKRKIEAYKKFQETLNEPDAQILPTNRLN